MSITSSPFLSAFVTVLLVLVEATVTHSALPPPLPEKDPPAAWKPSELDAALPNPTDSGPVTILVWEVIAFDGVFTDEERCLVLKRYDKPTAAGHRYAIGALWRQPKTERPVWKPTVQQIEVPDFGAGLVLTEVKAVEQYKDIPADNELRAFLKKHAWRDKLSARELVLRIGNVTPNRVRYAPKVVDGGLCKAAWKKSLNREPAAELFPELTVRTPEKK